MDNDKILKSILVPTNNLSEYFKILEQQEKLTKMISPSITMNNSIQQIVKHYETFDKINKSIKIPLTTAETIGKLINQTPEINKKYSKYYEQLNSIVKILNPSLSSFINRNSRSSFTESDSMKDVDLLYINSFDAIKDDYDDSVQDELNKLKDNFEATDEFKEEVESLLENGTKEITTDIYLAFANIIKKYVGEVNSQSIALFLSFLMLIYTVLMPLYQNKLESETEERLNIKIEQVQESIIKSNEKSNLQVLQKLDTIENPASEIEDKIIQTIDNKLEKPTNELETINKKIELLNKKVDKLNNQKNN